MLDESDPARGASLRRRREILLKTQVEVAAAARLGVVTVKRAEAGQPLRPETAAALCAVLGVRAGTFVAPAWGSEGTFTSGEGDPTSGPAEEIPPDVYREARRRRVRIGFVTLALAVEAASWMPFALSLATFVLLQRLAMVVVGAVVVDVLFHRAWTGWAAGVRGWRAALPAIAGLGILCWLPACEIMGEMATISDAKGIMHDYSQAMQAIRVRHLMDPAWDRTESQWALTSWLDGRLLVDDPRLRTPGTYAASIARVPSCLEEYHHAPTFDRERCWPSTNAIDGRGIDMVWQALDGGSAMSRPSYEDMTHGEHPPVMGWSGFDDARQLIAEGEGDAEPPYKIDERATAWAVAHRDRHGSGG